MGDFKFIGHGIYTINEVSRLTNIGSYSIRRWLKGYKYHSQKDIKEKPSVFKHDYPVINNKIALSFLDLIEIRFIHAFRQRGVSLNTIRIASINAANLFESTHPFAIKKIYTDGKTILTEIAHDIGEPSLLNLVESQFEIEDILRPILRGIEFSINDIAVRWWPLGENKSIVIDPERNFGKPIIDKYNITTKTLYRAFKKSKSYNQIASWYEIDKEAVRAAVEFEESLAA